MKLYHKYCYFIFFFILGLISVLKESKDHSSFHKKAEQGSVMLNNIL